MTRLPDSLSLSIQPCLKAPWLTITNEIAAVGQAVLPASNTDTTHPD